MLPLLLEQPGSALAALNRAGIKHGDLQRVTLVVGTMPGKGGQRFAFCPAEVRPGPVLQMGTKAARAMPLVGNIEIVNHRLVAARLSGVKGFVRMNGQVFCNGKPSLTVDLDSLEAFCLPQGEDEGVLVTTRGRPYAAQLLSDFGDRRDQKLLAI